MDRKAIIVLVISFLLFVAWAVLVPKLYPPKPLPRMTNLVAQATNTAAESNPPAPYITAPPANLPPKPVVRSTEPEQTEKLTVSGITYVFTSHGGGLKEVELDPKQYPEQVARKSETNGALRGAVLNRGAVSPVLALGGHASLQDDNYYQLTKLPGMLRAEKTLSNGLHVVKEFRPASNYLVNASVRLENRGAQPVLVPSQTLVAGTASLVHSKEDPMQIGAFAYNGQRVTYIDQAWFANSTLGCIPGTPREQFKSGEPELWTAVQNRFFALALVPKGMTNEPGPEVIAHKTDLQLDEKDPARRSGIEVALLYRGQNLAPNAAIDRQFAIYAGPKEYNGLARLGEQMNNHLDYVMKFNGFFGFFSKILMLSMNGLHDLLKVPYGLAIILITVIIKLLFWPLTRASTRSMKRMAELQPEMNKIKEKYKDEPQKMNKKMMEFMKENKVSPLGGCLPMLIQIPVFFGFYYMIQSAIELRGASFLWAWDLSVPDTVANPAGFPLNPLPLVMGVTMLYQAKLTPPSPGMDPTQQKLMQYMPLIFLFVLYNMSSGLTLYWTVQNVLTIVQTKLTKTAPKTTAPAPAAPVARKK
jgi:YidC/Oxa1 family membrane protein insertase